MSTKVPPASSSAQPSNLRTPPAVPVTEEEPANAGSGVQQRPATAPVAGRRKMVRPKMDFAKALSIMGFSTSRTLDPSGGHDAKVELNAALSRHSFWNYSSWQTERKHFSSCLYQPNLFLVVHYSADKAQSFQRGYQVYGHCRESSFDSTAEWPKFHQNSF